MVQKLLIEHDEECSELLPILWRKPEVVQVATNARMEDPARKPARGIGPIVLQCVPCRDEGARPLWQVWEIWPRLVGEERRGSGAFEGQILDELLRLASPV